MKIDDTIQALMKVCRAIDKGIPKTVIRPDALVADLKEFYVWSIENREFDELFEYDDVGSPSVTLIISVDAECDPKRVMKCMRTRLHAMEPGGADEMGNAGVVWSSGRYDVVYDEEAGLLRISHKYSHRRVDTKSVLSIVKKMMDYALGSLEEVQASAQESAGPFADRVTDSRSDFAGARKTMVGASFSSQPL